MEQASQTSLTVIDSHQCKAGQEYEQEHLNNAIMVTQTNRRSSPRHIRPTASVPYPVSQGPLVAGAAAIVGADDMAQCATGEKPHVRVAILAQGKKRLHEARGVFALRVGADPRAAVLESTDDGLQLCLPCVGVCGRITWFPAA